MLLRLTQRQINLGVFGFNTLMAWLLFADRLLSRAAPISIVIVGVIALALSILSAAYWYGWTYARHVLVLGMLVATTLLAPPDLLRTRLSLSVLLAPVLALTLTEPVWVLGVGLAVFGIIGARTGGQSVYFEPGNLALAVALLGGMVLSRLAIDNALLLDGARRSAEEARACAEEQARDLARQARELHERSEQQQRLLDLVATLETPAITLADGVLLAPLVGSLDTRRAEVLTTRLLDAVNTKRARLVVLDIAGVTLVDTEVAQALLRTVQALRLLGSEVAITGIAPSVALTLTQLGIRLTGVFTAASPQEALTRWGAVPQRVRDN